MVTSLPITSSSSKELGMQNDKDPLAGLRVDSLEEREQRLASTGSVAITLTWSGTLPMLIAVLEDGSEEGKQIAREELARMAELADRYVSLSK
jgi:hypothetical protein